METPRTLWTFVITSLALFMVVLDNLVVSTALPVIRTDLDASLEELEWTVNAYTLTFAVLLLTGAALGDRFGRRRVFAAGLTLFTAASAAAALAPSMDALIAARAIQGIGGAIVTPLTLTILSDAFPKEKRGLALGAWSGIAGLAVASGPLVGGAVVDGISWQWIFWLNVPIGILLVPLALRFLRETYGPDRGLDLPGLALVSVGLLGLVWGLIHGNGDGWTSPQIVGSLAVGAILTAAFVAWELRTPAPMLPMRFFRDRAFAAANGASLLMYFGMFGSIFLLTQFLQTVQGHSPLGAGLRVLPWTAMPMIVAPIAGALSDRIGGRPLMAVGLALQAIGLGWLAAVSTPTVPYTQLVIPFILSGTGMAMFFAPVANVVLSAVRPEEEGKASGTNNAIREVGGVFGVAVLASVFASYGGYGTPQSFVDGLTPAIWVGAIVVGAGSLISLLIPRRIRREEQPEVVLEAAA
ncbi:MAG TPA: DHA2 family efflux MFS transporter permease subunit [Gaiellaceae bacterium]|jgi:EmrB/QacA subfamily drug resistance transporter|nr:family efflux transporter permease subunit [Gaiellaceae bacterium]HKI22104.1 DHA2 family efflux MFS transporter permease subunit [Gaiellaceae bacterium]